MNKNLYFIEIFNTAFQQADPKVALRNAFEQIQHLGRQKQFRDGFCNFERFMEQVSKYRKLRETDSVRQLITEIATETFSGTEKQRRAVVESIAFDSEVKAEYEKVCRQVCRDCCKQTAVIQFFRDKLLIGEMTFSEAVGRKTIGRILPGDYTLKLDTGRVVWQGNLSGQDLIWIEAFGTRKLDLAAETSGIKRLPVRSETLLDGDMILRTFAGIESGTIEIELID